MRLEVTTDGRHLTFILVSLYEAGFGVQVYGGDWFFRELMLLRKTAPIPFLYGGKETECGISITDRPSPLDTGRSTLFVLDYDYFTEKLTELHMPYFMQPKALHGGYHKIHSGSLPKKRGIRLGFYGTHNREYYTKHFRFPILPRTPILDCFNDIFSGEFQPAGRFLSEKIPVTIAVSMDYSATDQVKKNYLAQKDYFTILEQTEFMLCPPGWCMPQSHNLIEAMSHGVIPILNYPDYMVPNLKNGYNCLAFSTLKEMEERIQEALGMSQSGIHNLRTNVVRYYQDYLAPGSWWRRLLRNRNDDVKIFVNDEAASVHARDGDFLTTAREFIEWIPKN